jgi:hypothetical protein
MRVQVTVPVIINGEQRQSGDVLDLPADTANPLIASGRGVRAPDDAPLPAPDPAAEE